MKIEKTIKESPAFTLEYSDYNESANYNVSWFELKNAEIGTLFEIYHNSNCGQSVNEETAQVVFVSDNGCAVLFRRYGTTDSPDPEDWENEPTLQWFEFS